MLQDKKYIKNIDHNNNKNNKTVVCRTVTRQIIQRILKYRNRIINQSIKMPIKAIPAIDNWFWSRQQSKSFK